MDERRALLRDMLPILGNRVLSPTSPEDGILPVVIVDMSQRPDVADLPRVHYFEGASSGRAEWEFVKKDEETLAVLSYALATPVRCRFTLAWSLPRDLPFLRLIAWAARFTLMDAPPERTASGFFDATRSPWYRVPIGPLYEVLPEEGGPPLSSSKQPEPVTWPEARTPEERGTLVQAWADRERRLLTEWRDRGRAWLAWALAEYAAQGARHHG